MRMSLPDAPGVTQRVGGDGDGDAHGLAVLGDLVRLRVEVDPPAPGSFPAA